jgi:hypothetical protein
MLTKAGNILTNLFWLIKIIAVGQTVKQFKIGLSVNGKIEEECASIRIYEFGQNEF